MGSALVQDGHAELREGVRALCAQFDSAYWQKVDEARAYPEAFVDALTKAGWMAALIPELRRAGSRMNGLQLWVALPRAHEETAPEFRHHPAGTLPAFEEAGARIRVLAGDRVTVEISPYDVSKGRINYRHRDASPPPPVTARSFQRRR